MGAFTAGSVILVPFPFSDLSRSKRRPAVVLANAGRGDWILCQITSKSYEDARSVPLSDKDFKHGGLRLDSYVRPAKLFTAHDSLFILEVGVLGDAVLKVITDHVISMIQQSAA